MTGWSAYQPSRQRISRSAGRGGVQKESHVIHDNFLLAFPGEVEGTAVRMTDFPVAFPIKKDVDANAPGGSG